MTWSRWKDILAGAAWGVFFSVAPLDLLFIGALAWIPLLLWLELRRPRPAGSASTLSLEKLAGELGELRISFNLAKEIERRASLVLPSTNPTLREIIREVEAKTSLRYQAGYCGNGKTVLWGGYPMSLAFGAP